MPFLFCLLFFLVNCYILLLFTWYDNFLFLKCMGDLHERIFNMCACLQLLRSLVCNLMSLGLSITWKALGLRKLRSLRNRIYVLCGICFCTSQVKCSKSWFVVWISIWFHLPFGILWIWLNIFMIFIMCTRVLLLSFWLFFFGIIILVHVEYTNE